MIATAINSIPGQSQITLEEATEENIDLVKRLNQVVFPISFENKFYKDIVRKDSGICCKLAYLNKTFVGAITYKIEEKRAIDPNKSERFERNLYIMTLGCYAFHRGKGVGSKLLLEAISSSGQLHNITLHVQATNEDAVNFYRRFQFEILETVSNFYRRIQDEKLSGKQHASPRDALVLGHRKPEQILANYSN